MSELGQSLREAREAKGLSLEELQEITKIQKRYLIALESGDFKQLPGNFYTRAFIKNYAENVGLDAQAFFDEHAGEIPKAQTEPVNPIIPSRSTVHKPKKQPNRRVSSKGSKVEAMLPKILLIVLILILLVAVWVVMQQVTGRSSHSGTSGNNGVNVSYKKEKTQTKSPQQNKTKSDTNTHKSQQKKTSKKESQPSFVLTKDSSSGSTTYYTLSNAQKFKMTIKSSDGNNSWVSATDTTTNKQYAYGTVNKTTSFSFDASSSKQISINVGSVPHTSITINGKPFKFPSNNITQRIYITYKK